MTRQGDDPALADSFLERTQAGDLFSAAPRARHPLPVSCISIDCTSFSLFRFPPCACIPSIPTSNLA